MNSICMWSHWFSISLCISVYIYIYWFVHLIKIWSSHMSPCHYFKSPSGNTTITLITRLAKRDPMSGSRHKQTSPWKNHGELWAMKFQMQNQTLSHPKWGDVYFITEKQQQQRNNNNNNNQFWNTNQICISLPPSWVSKPAKVAAHAEQYTTSHWWHIPGRSTSRFFHKKKRSGPTVGVLLELYK